MAKNKRKQKTIFETIRKKVAPPTKKFRRKDKIIYRKRKHKTKDYE